jgi:hypothetical protein
MGGTAYLLHSLERPHSVIAQQVLQSRFQSEPQEVPRRLRLAHPVESAACIIKSDVIRFWSGNLLLLFDITVILGVRPHRISD